MTLSLIWSLGSDILFGNVLGFGFGYATCKNGNWIVRIGIALCAATEFVSSHFAVLFFFLFFSFLSPPLSAFCVLPCFVLFFLARSSFFLFFSISDFGFSIFTLHCHCCDCDHIPIYYEG